MKSSFYLSLLVALTQVNINQLKKELLRKDLRDLNGIPLHVSYLSSSPPIELEFGLTRPNQIPQESAISDLEDM